MLSSRLLLRTAAASAPRAGAIAPRVVVPQIRRYAEEAQSGGSSSGGKKQQQQGGGGGQGAQGGQSAQGGQGGQGGGSGGGSKQLEARPPVTLFGVDGTYASALFTAASKTQTLEPTGRALSSLHQTFVNDPKLTKILTSPTLTQQDKKDLISELLKAAGVSESSKEGGTVKNFLQTLADNNRLSVLRGVCEKFEELMSAHRGEIELRITSAEKLDQKVVRQIESAVGKSKFVGQAKKIKVVPKVVPEIKGGLIVEVGDRTIDLSVASKMARMNKLLQDQL